MAAKPPDQTYGAHTEWTVSLVTADGQEVYASTCGLTHTLSPLRVLPLRES